VHRPEQVGPLSGVQFCVLVLKNGHLVTGEALLQDLSKPDPERARASARRRAFDKAYDMVVYVEREKLATQ
jgi:RNA polymerase-interacting CarD/CdnL/TRCF family regulator